MSIGKPRKRPEHIRKVVCGKCGEIFNIALTADTRNGYICPGCARREREKRGLDRRKHEESAGTEIKEGNRGNNRKETR